MTEENRAPPRHHCRPGCRRSADRALARHVGVAAFKLEITIWQQWSGPGDCFPQPEVALPDASPSYEDGWAHAGARLVTGPFAVVQHLTMPNSPWDGQNHPTRSLRIVSKTPRCKDGEFLGQSRYVVDRRGRDVVTADAGT